MLSEQKTRYQNTAFRWSDPTFRFHAEDFVAISIYRARSSRCGEVPRWIPTRSIAYCARYILPSARCQVLPSARCLIVANWHVVPLPPHVIINPITRLSNGGVGLNMYLGSRRLVRFPDPHYVVSRRIRLAGGPHSRHKSMHGSGCAFMHWFVLLNEASVMIPAAMIMPATRDGYKTNSFIYLI